MTIYRPLLSPKASYVMWRISWLKANGPLAPPSGISVNVKKGSTLVLNITTRG